ncbi:MAG: hypothetical protein IJ308_04215 [Clostridia bacterium]|nr:hypothetical protein [Clostridia bacterium]
MVEQVCDNKKQKIWDKAFGLALGGVALAAALLAVLFTFLSGFSLTVNGDAGSISGMAASESMDLFYFFGNVYKDIADGAKEFEEMLCGELMVGNMYLYAVLSTVVAVGMVGCVIGFSIPAVISYVKYANGQTEKHSHKWAVWTVFSFLGGVAALYALNYMSIGMGVGTDAASVKIAPTKTTVAGIVLCVVFLAIWLGGKIASYGKAWKEKTFTQKTVCVLVSLVFCIPLFVLWQRAALTLSLANSDATVNTAFAPVWNNSYLLSMFESALTEKYIYECEPNLMAAYVCSLTVQFIMLGGIACVIGCFVSRYNTMHGKNRNALIWSAMLVGLSLCLLATFIVMQANIDYIMNYVTTKISASAEIGFTYGYGVCIALIVLSVFNLFASILQYIFANEKKEAQTEETQA